MLLNFGAAAGTGIDEIACEQPIHGCLIQVRAFALTNDGLSPLETEHVKCADDAIGTTGDFPWPVQIFHPDQPVALCVAGIQIACDRSDQRAEMQEASRGGGETAKVGRH